MVVIIPVAMIIMMALCFFMMRGRMAWMMCPSSASGDSSWNRRSQSARDILDKRYAGGRLGRKNEEEKTDD
jgi:uncharacterized membrane protein